MKSKLLLLKRNTKGRVRGGGGKGKKKQVIRASSRESDTGFDALPVVHVSQRAAVCWIP
jgi:hypothetical protein